MEILIEQQSTELLFSVQFVLFRHYPNVYQTHNNNNQNIQSMLMECKSHQGYTHINNAHTMMIIVAQMRPTIAVQSERFMTN